MLTNLGGSYQLISNIDLGATSSALWSSGFAPIGYFNHGANPFTGTFNGNGYTVSNLNMNLSATHAGFFGTNDGTIENLGIVSGTVIGLQAVGGIAGENNGIITDSYVMLTVEGGNNVGGIAGVNNTGGTISNSYSTNAVGSSIEGQSEATGGQWL